MADTDKQRQFVSYSPRFKTLILTHCLHSTYGAIVALPTYGNHCMSLTGHLCRSPLVTGVRLGRYSEHTIHTHRIHPSIESSMTDILTYPSSSSIVASSSVFSPTSRKVHRHSPRVPTIVTDPSGSTSSSSVVCLHDRGSLVLYVRQQPSALFGSWRRK